MGVPVMRHSRTSRMNQYAVAILMLIYTGCAAHMASVEKIAVNEEEFGTFSSDGGRPKLLESVSEVPCIEGTSFGSTLRVNYPYDGTIRLPLQARWTMPEVPGFQNAELVTLEEPIEAPMNAEGLALSFVSSLDGVDERFEGTYTLFVENWEGTISYHERSFRVVGCAN